MVPCYCLLPFCYSSSSRDDLCGRLQVLGETLEAAVPAALMVIARADRFEQSLSESQPRFSAEILEGHRQQGLRPGRIACGVGPNISADESLRGRDLAIDALLPMIAALRIAHIESIGAARARIVSLDSAGEALRAQPLDHVFGVAPDLVDQLAGRIEDPGDDEFALGGAARRDVTTCSHDTTPCRLAIE